MRFSFGGNSDILGRHLADGLLNMLGQQSLTFRLARPHLRNNHGDINYNVSLVELNRIESYL